MYEKLKKRGWLPYLIAFIDIICIGLAIYITTPRVTNVTAVLPNGEVKRLDNLYNDFPYNETSSPDAGEMRIKAVIRYEPYSQRIFSIMPDDCLYSMKINGKNVTLPQAQPCLSDKGIAVDVSKYLRRGNNILELDIKNNGGPFGLYIRNTLTDPVFAVLAFIGIANLMVIVWLILRSLKFARSTALILMGGLLIRFWYMGYTVFMTRAHDVWPHLQYMSIISRMFILPGADACYECHQQPLYYILSSLVVSAARLVNIQDYYSLLQAGNVLLFFILAVVVALLFRRIWKETALQNIAVALFVFWPSGIIHSARIGNDIPFYLGYGLALYFLYRYLFAEKENANRYLLLVLAVAAATVFIKINAVAILPLIIGVYLYKHYKQGFSTSLFLFLVACSGIIVTASFVPYFFQQNQRSFFSRITKSDQIGSNLRTGNKLINYVYFDQNIFLKVPFASPWEDASGRQYVWNYFLKSSLFGEFRFDQPVLKGTAVMLSYLALAFFFLMFSGVLLLNRKDIRQLVLFAMSMVALLVMYLYYRINFPASSNTDFRYIFPVLISFIFLYMYSLQKFREKGIRLLSYFGYAVAIAFVILTQYFFIIIPLIS